MVASARFAMYGLHISALDRLGMVACLHPHKNFLSSDIIFGNILFNVLKHCKTVSFHYYMFRSHVLLTFIACIICAWILYPNKPFSEKEGGDLEYWRCCLPVGFNSVHLHFINCINTGECYCAMFIYRSSITDSLLSNVFFSVMHRIVTKM